MRWIKILILISLLFVISCAHNQVLTGTVPVTETAYWVRSFGTDIVVNYGVAKYETLEEKGSDGTVESRLIPRFLMIDDPNKVWEFAPPVAALTWHVDVNNSKKVKYKLVEEYDINYGDGKGVYHIAHTLYDGSISQNRFQVESPFRKGLVVAMKLSIKESSTNEDLIVLGEIKYQIPK